MKNIASSRIAGFIERHTDIALGLVLLIVLCLLLLPIPFFLLDLAIAANFAFTILLLTVTLYLRGILELSVFPSLLLLTTLFRLGLSVATTKMILLHANAGEMVHTFGELVVGGNVVVGLVIFVLLTVVQFLVVAKGGDRIAEVAARFTLDAIPGKQMSIDADLRAGSIDAMEAKRRRDTMQQEIQLYGALDGAMKFVKGDAIIGLVIALINIIGGITIGMLMNKMPFGEAVNTYVILTVGDGLVSQIPSLMVAIAAGLMITRVTSSDSDADGKSGHLGQSIYTQIARKPKAILMAAVAAAAFGMVPGFPLIQFFILSGILFIVAFAQWARVNTHTVPMPHMRRDGANYIPNILDGIELGTQTPLLVRIGKNAFSTLDAHALNSALGKARKDLSEALGLPFPGVTMVGETEFEPERYVIEVDGSIAFDGKLWPDATLVHGEEQQLKPYQNERPDFFPGSPAAYWVSSEQAQEARQAGLSTSAAHDVLVAHIHALCVRHSFDFVGTEETQYLLNRLASAFPTLVETLQQGTTASTLAPVLSDLLRENISIRPLKSICEAIVKCPAGERNQSKMLAGTRIALGKYFIPQYVDPATQQISALVLGNEWEEIMRDALRMNADGEVELALPLRDLEDLQHALARELQELPSSAVIMTSSELRKPLWKMVRALSARHAVLGFEEVPSPGPRITQVAVI